MNKFKEDQEVWIKGKIFKDFDDCYAVEVNGGDYCYRSKSDNIVMVIPEDILEYNRICSCKQDVDK